MTKHATPARAFTLDLKTEAETRALATRFAGRLAAGDVVLLTGEIGAGKSFFARSVIQTLLAAAGRVEDVPSPTYTLVQTYQVGETEIWHADLYRLSDLAEVEELGLADAFRTAISLVEWADRLGPGQPADALLLRLEITPDPGQRRLRMSWSSPHWDWIQDLEAVWHD